jgi:hypothetical protein
MDGDSSKIKRFGDFMSSKRYARALSHLIVKGKTKSSFFFNSKEFEIHFYFTPIKKIILEIKSEGIDLQDQRLNFNFKIGDSIDSVKKWIVDNGHEITFELNR